MFISLFLFLLFEVGDSQSVILHKYSIIIAVVGPPFSLIVDEVQISYEPFPKSKSDSSFFHCLYSNASFKTTSNAACCFSNYSVNEGIFYIVKNNHTRLDILSVHGCDNERTVFWDVKPCSLVDKYQLFRRTYFSLYSDIRSQETHSCCVSTAIYAITQTA